MSSARITSVRFQNYKALRDYQVRLTETNFLIGPNNAGKSTIIGAFRVLAVALRRMAARKPDIVVGPNGRRYGTSIPIDTLPISIENVHTDLSEADTIVSFHISNGNELQLYFPKDGSCFLIAEAHNRPLLSIAIFRSAFPITLAVIPVLAPVEQGEERVQEETVQKNISTHRASRNFRSYWYYRDEEHFKEFAEIIAETWPGMEIEKPVVANHATGELLMFCKENRFPRELFWIGSGFQIWCQLLTHLIRAKDASLVVIDEPEIYLHADLQRQLVGFLRRFESDVLLATHSTEIMGEAEPSEMVLIDKRGKTAERLKNIEKLQLALSEVGSIHNISLSRLARSRRIVFFEGERDFKLIRMLARQLGYAGIASGLEIFPAFSEGFGSWEKVSALGWGIARALDNELAIGAVYDRDYFPDDQIEHVQDRLNNGLRFSHIHERKEIENYLLLPEVLDRALQSSVADKARREEIDAPKVTSITDLLRDVTEDYRTEVFAQRVAREVEFRKSLGLKLDPTTLQAEAIKRFETAWKNLDTRLNIVPGKEVLSSLREKVSDKYGVTLSDSKIIGEILRVDVPEDIMILLEKLEAFRTAAVREK